MQDPPYNCPCPRPSNDRTQTDVGLVLFFGPAFVTLAAQRLRHIDRRVASEVSLLAQLRWYSPLLSNVLHIRTDEGLRRFKRRCEDSGAIPSYWRHRAVRNSCVLLDARSRATIGRRTLRDVGPETVREDGQATLGWSSSQTLRSKAMAGRLFRPRIARWR